VEQWIKPRRATLSKQRTAAERGSELSRNNLGVVRGYHRLWHNPVAPATGQPVRLLGYFDLSLVFCVSQPSSGNSSVQSS
jgi:hypothetical protein